MLAGSGRRSFAPWWVGLMLVGVGALLAVLWIVFGGFPFTNHSAHGRVPVPGSATLALPAGVVWVNFEEDGISGENDSADMPTDLEVGITGAGGLLVIERLSANLFSISTNETGHVPYGRVVVPAAASYQVTTTASERTSAVSPRVTFGEPPLNPFGPVWVGALLLLAPFAVLALLLTLPLRRR